MDNEDEKWKIAAEEVREIVFKWPPLPMGELFAQAEAPTREQWQRHHLNFLDWFNENERELREIEQVKREPIGTVCTSVIESGRSCGGECEVCQLKRGK